MFDQSKLIFESQQIFDEILLKTQKAKLENQIPREKIWMGTYFDQEIEKGIHPSISIRFVDEEVGWGAFAAERISVHTFVGEYTGIVFERESKDLKGKVYCVRYTVWEMRRRNFVIDAEKVGNFTRFINHSDTPNLSLQSIYWRGIPRMVFVALQEIHKDQQLTFDYGTFFWQECHRTPKLL